jgi:hypothetical protein
MPTNKAKTATGNAPRKVGRPAKRKAKPKTAWDKALQKVKNAHSRVKTAKVALAKAEEVLANTPKD